MWADCVLYTPVSLPLPNLCVFLIAMSLTLPPSPTHSLSPSSHAYLASLTSPAFSVGFNSAVTDSINQLITMCTQQAPGQKECDNALRELEVFLSFHIFFLCFLSRCFFVLRVRLCDTSQCMSDLQCEVEKVVWVVIGCLFTYRILLYSKKLSYFQTL